MRRPLLVGLAGSAPGIAVASSQRGRRMLRRNVLWVSRHAQHQIGRVKGLLYRLSGRHPSTDVDPLLLHGKVARRSDADRIEQAVRHMPGVGGVESYLRVGLIGGDTRPSQGRSVAQPSDALKRLLGAARAAGADEHSDKALVRAVLATLVARLPTNERDQLLTHLPFDVRTLAEPPRRHGRAPTRIRHVGEFVAATGADSIDPSRATAIVKFVLAVLRDLVPEESADIAAVLPTELKPLWQGSVSR